MAKYNPIIDRCWECFRQFDDGEMVYGFYENFLGMCCMTPEETARRVGHIYHPHNREDEKP